MANEVRVLITAQDKASPTIKEIAGGIVAAEVAMKAFNTAVNGLTGSIKVAADFEKTMSSVGAVSQATKEELKGLGDEAKRIGKDTMFGATEAAGAMEILAANGISARDIMGGAADAAATLAAAGGTNLAQAADTVSTSMSIWGATTQDLTEYVNRLAGAANVSRFGVEDMSQAIAQGGGVAAASGVDFGDFAATIAATASSFSSGSDAGTSFKTFLQRLAAPSKEGAQLMKELGINAFDATGQMRPMGEVVQQLHDSLGMMSDAQRSAAASTIFGSDAMRTAMSLSGMTREEYEKLSATMKDTSAQDIAKQRTDNLAGAWENLMGAIETIQIEIGEKLIPVLAELARWGADKLPAAFEWMEREWGPAFERAGAAIQGVLPYLQGVGDWFSTHEGVARAFADGLAVATAGMIAFGVASAAAALVNPFTATIVAIAAVSVALTYLIQNWEELREQYAAIDAASNGVVAAFEFTTLSVQGWGIALGEAAEAVDWLVDKGQEINDWLDDHGMKWEALALVLAGPIPAAVVALIDHFDEVKDWFRDLPGEVETALGDLGDYLYEAGRDLIQGLWDGAKDKAEDFGGWMRDLPSDIVGWVKDAADGHSPWGITEPLGEDLVAGIQAGVENAFPALEATVSGRVQDLARNVYAVVQDLFASLASVDIYGPDVSTPISYKGDYLQGPHIGKTPEQIRDANRSAMQRIFDISTTGGSGGGGAAAAAGKTAGEEFADAFAESVRDASLALEFGEMGGKAMAAFADAFENPRTAASLPKLIEDLVDEATAAGVPNAAQLGADLAAAIGEGLESGSTEGVAAAMKSLTGLTSQGVKAMIAEAQKLLTNSPLTDAARKSAEATMKGFSDTIASGGTVAAEKLRAFLDGLTDKAEDGFETLRETTIPKLEDWLDDVVRKLRDTKPDTDDALRSMVDGLASILKSAPLAEATGDFVDTMIQAFRDGIKSGSGLAIGDLEGFINELIQRIRDAKNQAAAEAGSEAPEEPWKPNNTPLTPGASTPGTPTGAYGQPLVWDEDNKAWTYPWMVGGAFGQRGADGMLQFQPFGGVSQPIHVTLEVDGQVLASAVATQQARAY